MKNIHFFALVFLCATSNLAASAQQSAYQHFRAHNDAMTALQPSWMGPLIQSDSRLAQAVRVSVTNSFASHQTNNYGNGHGISVIAANRFQFDLIPAPYIQNHSAKRQDGVGDLQTQVKLRLASGNAQHGNYALSAILNNSYPTGSYTNGAATASLNPRLASGVAFGRYFDLQTTLGGVLPTHKVDAQGRAIEWNLTGQVHPTAHLWFDAENNAAFILGGPNDGKKQNFVTPAAFYMVRRKSWGPTHAAVIFDAGMQIATSSFHFYNHNLITEARILF